MLAELEKAQRFREALSRGEPQLGAQISLADSAVVEILGRSGFDWLLIDHEHTSLSDDDDRRMHQAGIASRALVLARPPRLDPPRVMRLLDLGASGVVCPFISTAEQADELVRVTRFPPAGERSWGPRRAAEYGMDGARYHELANAAILRFAIIETPQAVEQIDAITSVDGLDGVIVGPQDLALRLGTFGRFDTPEYRRAVDRVRACCAEKKMPFGTGCYSLDDARDCLAQGDLIPIVAGDDGMLVSASRDMLGQLRGQLAVAAASDGSAQGENE